MAGEKHHLRRDRRLTALLALAAVACTTGVFWRVAFAAPVPELPTRAVASAAPDKVEILFGGDTMVGDAALPLIQAKGADAVFTEVGGLLRGADVTIVNAEAPISPSDVKGDVTKQFSYTVQPEHAAAMTRAGIDVLVLGNNHTMDRGAAGLTDTLRFARDAGLSTVGAGMTRAEAEKPLILDTAVGKVGIVSFGENFGPLSRSTVTTPGMVPFSPDKISRGLTLARSAGATYVVAYAHWGDNYAPVNEQQRHWAEMLADAGYDLVVGSGSHTLQSVEIVKGVPVLFGLGNTAFGSNGRYSEFGQLGVAALARLTLDGQGKASLALSCIQADNAVTGYVPRPCTVRERESAATVVGPRVRWSGDVGVVDTVSP